MTQIPSALQPILDSCVGSDAYEPERPDGDRAARRRERARIDVSGVFSGSE